MEYKNNKIKYSQINFRSNIDGKISKNINLSFDISGRQETEIILPSLPGQSLAEKIWKWWILRREIIR